MVTRAGSENAVVWVNHEEECSTEEILEELDTKQVQKVLLCRNRNIFHGVIEVYLIHDNTESSQ